MARAKEWQKQKKTRLECCGQHEFRLNRSLKISLELASAVQGYPGVEVRQKRGEGEFTTLFTDIPLMMTMTMMMINNVTWKSHAVVVARH